MNMSRGTASPSGPNAYELPVPFGYGTQADDPISRMARLQFFILAAPSYCRQVSFGDQQTAGCFNPANAHDPGPGASQLRLPTGEHVTCIAWSGVYFITGTDIGLHLVRILLHRFQTFGRPVLNLKKFEESVFSDLRNLKPGRDASLEEPKSPLLDLLFKLGCIRTQKKQKVFYWFNVPHNRLFLDALERDLKREKSGFTPTSRATGEPALSFIFDSKRSLYEQFTTGKHSRFDGVNLIETEPNVPSAPVVRNTDAATAVLRLPQLHGGSSAYKRRKRRISVDPHSPPPSGSYGHEQRHPRALRLSSAPSALSAVVRQISSSPDCRRISSRSHPIKGLDQSARYAQQNQNHVGPFQPEFPRLPAQNVQSGKQIAPEDRSIYAVSDGSSHFQATDAALSGMQMLETFARSTSVPLPVRDVPLLTSQRPVWQAMGEPTTKPCVCRVCSVDLGHSETLHQNQRGSCHHPRDLHIASQQEDEAIGHVGTPAVRLEANDRGVGINFLPFDEISEGRLSYTSNIPFSNATLAKSLQSREALS